MINIHCRDQLRQYVEGHWDNTCDGDEILRIIDSLEKGGIVKDSKGNYGVSGDPVHVTYPDGSEADGVIRWSDDDKEFLVGYEPPNKEVHYLGEGWREIKSFEFIYPADKQRRYTFGPGIEHLDYFAHPIAPFMKRYSKEIVNSFVITVNDDCEYPMIYTPDEGEFCELYSAEFNWQDDILTLNTSNGQVKFTEEKCIMDAIQLCFFFDDEVSSGDLEALRIYLDEESEESEGQEHRDTRAERKAKSDAEKEYFDSIKCPACGSPNWTLSSLEVFPESNTHVCDECGTIFCRAKFEG